jgi:hypothetical protein
MSWLIIEGIDRSGKSTVAELYKTQGYEFVHMSAPDKKYKQPGYSGPSYLDDMLEMCMQYDGKDVVFDRSIYGECVWPHVYGREPMLSEEDIEVLQEFEERNQVSRILMVDPNTAEHWKRCVDNKEPLTQSQFRLAGSLYTKLAHKYNFVPKQLSDYSDKFKKTKTETMESIGTIDNEVRENGQTTLAGKSVSDINSNNPTLNKIVYEKIFGLDKLEKANAISAILSKRIIKQRGSAFDELEGEVTDFLKRRLEELLGGKKEQSALSFADEEVQILKIFCQRLKEKELQSSQQIVSKKPTASIRR